MFNTLYILQWDNYYDRRVRPGLSELQGGGLDYYLPYSTISFTGVNFNPNDHINTEVILNINENQFGNYLIVLNESNDIVSRWFIIEAIRVRGNQYNLSLHRDVITDYWNIIKQAPSLIEKCNINYSDPLIFNNEDMTVNQIKKGETLLKDKTQCPWLIAYIAKDAGAINGAAKVGSDLDSSAIAINDTYTNWEKEHSTYYGDFKNIDYQVYYKVIDGESQKGYVKLNGYSGEAVWNYTGESNSYTKGTSLRLRSEAGWTFSNPVLSSLEKGIKAVGVDALRALVPAYATDRHTEEDVQEFLDYNGKTIRDIDGNYFKVSITEAATETKVYDIASGSLFNQLSSAMNESTFKLFGTEYTLFRSAPNEYSFRLEIVYNVYKTTLSPLINSTITYSIPESRISTEDAAYDMLAIPYGRIYAGTVEGEGTIDTNAEIGLAVIQSIAKNLDAACYDIQLVPYCPLQDYIAQRKTVKTWNTTGMNHYITQGNTKVGIIYSVPKANFTFNLLNSIDAARSSIERKINNDCDKWRLCSPNYSNYFDFNVEKNDGVQYFNVDCCYKPYTPYIHVNPNFNNLYGQDYNDPRGLVCGGDFSLSQVRNAWESYQLQNKNFQATFDRQIQNMEITNKYQRIVDVTSAVSGTLQGGVSGAATGLFASGGNPYAAIAGAAIGTVTSAAAGAADVIINEKLRNEALDYTKDQFGYQLGNIQAIPLTLTKVDAFNNNNKIFPVIEYYTCTDREKEAYVYKLAYNGMTNMTIGTLEDNINETWEYTINNKTIKSQNYVKARPIHLLMNDDFHVANMIAKEMNMGFYIVEEE